MATALSFKQFSDRDLVCEVKRLAQSERSATAALIASLAEMDARRLYLGEGCASLFVYCTRVLHLSEHAAYGRIEAARVAQRFPVVLERLERGELTLSTLCLLRPHLTEANWHGLLEAARHASKRDVERLIATIAPRADAPTLIRKLPTPPHRDAPATPALLAPAVNPATPAGPALPGRSAAGTSPLSAERYKVQFTVSRETHDKLRRAQDLLRHSIPDGDPAAVFDRALTLLLEHLERTKLAQAKTPRESSRPIAPGSRHIPRRCAAPSGRVTTAAVRSKAARAAAARLHSWSSTTSSRSPAAERQPSTTFRFAAAITISTKP